MTKNAIMTVTSRELQTFRKLRRNGRANSDCMLPETAQGALRQAKWETKTSNLPLQYDGDTWETEDGFTIVLSIQSDDLSLEDVLGDCYGEITNGTPDRNGVTGVKLENDRCGRNRSYFPSRHHTFDDRLAQCRKAGMCRNAAWLAARAGLQAEAEQYLQFTEDGCSSVWLQCKAYRTSEYDEVKSDAEEMGEDSIGGTEADHWQDCLLDYGLHENALEEARKAWSTRMAEEAADLEASRPDMYA